MLCAPNPLAIAQVHIAQAGTFSPFVASIDVVWSL